MDWLDLLAVQGTLKSLLQHQNSKASILRYSAFIMVQLSHLYITPGKTIALTRQTFTMIDMSQSPAECPSVPGRLLPSLPQTGLPEELRSCVFLSRSSPLPLGDSLTPILQMKSENKDDDLDQGHTGEKRCRQIWALALHHWAQGAVGREGGSEVGVMLGGGAGHCPETKGWTCFLSREQGEDAWVG